MSWSPLDALPTRAILAMLHNPRLPRRWWTPLVCVLARRGLVKSVELVEVETGRRW